jgi:hypothetical protein
MRARHFKIGPRSSIAFDTAWLLALSLNASLEDAVKMQQLDTEKDRNKYFDLTQKLRERMISMDFEGISVSLDNWPL